MLSEAKHLSGIAMFYIEMLHFVQHDNGFRVQYQLSLVWRKTKDSRWQSFIFVLRPSPKSYAFKYFPNQSNVRGQAATAAASL